MTNNVVADNQLTSTTNFTGNGSGLYIAGSSPQLLHTTIARNSGGHGSGVYVTDAFGSFSTVALTNTILVSHTVGITVAANNTATLNGVLWYSNTANTGGSGTITVTNEHTSDPAFTADGYHLTGTSAAIDKGLNAGVDDDIDDEPRPVGLGYDFGADEYYHPALEVIKQANPSPVLAGASLTYTIRVTNTGNVTLNATITDDLPRWVTPTGTITWIPVVIAPGGVWTGTVNVTAKIGYSGTLPNVVQVATSEGAMGVYTETSTVIVTPALVVTKQADPSPVQPGAQLTYTIRVTNTGNVTLNATITDILPRWVTFTGMPTWPAVITAPGGVWPMSFAVTVEADYEGPLTNKVQVTTQEGATGKASITICVNVCKIYLPVILKNSD